MVEIINTPMASHEILAKTYMAKMGGVIVAENTADGVKFILSLQLGMTKK